MNEGLMGLEWHEGGVINTIIFILGLTVPLNFIIIIIELKVQ